MLGIASILACYYLTLFNDCINYVLYLQFLCYAWPLTRFYFVEHIGRLYIDHPSPNWSHMWLLYLHASLIWCLLHCKSVNIRLLLWENDRIYSSGMYPLPTLVAYLGNTHHILQHFPGYSCDCVWCTSDLPSSFISICTSHKETVYTQTVTLACSVKGITQSFDVSSGRKLNPYNSPTFMS